MKLRALPERIGHSSASLAFWRRSSHRGVSLGLMFKLGVDFGADEDDHGRYPDPGHKADGRAERSVRLVVAAEMGGVPGEPLPRRRTSVPPPRPGSGLNPGRLRKDMECRVRSLDVQLCSDDIATFGKLHPRAEPAPPAIIFRFGGAVLLAAPISVVRRENVPIDEPRWPRIATTLKRSLMSVRHQALNCSAKCRRNSKARPHRG